LEALPTTSCQDPRQGKRAALRIRWLQDLALNKGTQVAVVAVAAFLHLKLRHSSD